MFIGVAGALGLSSNSGTGSCVQSLKESFCFSLVPGPTVECGRRTPSGHPAWGGSVQTRLTKSPAAWTSTASTTSTTSQVKEMLNSVKCCTVFVKLQWSGATPFSPWGEVVRAVDRTVRASHLGWSGWSFGLLPKRIVKGLSWWMFLNFNQITNMKTAL